MEEGVKNPSTDGSVDPFQQPMTLTNLKKWWSILLRKVGRPFLTYHDIETLKEGVFDPSLGELVDPS